nr:hypothetical protein [Tanacetum cinerariifolium]
MDPNSSLGKIYLGEDVVVISSDKVEGSGDWNSPEFQDIANIGQNKVMDFYQMDTKEVSDRFMAPCFVNGLEACDGEIDDMLRIRLCDAGSDEEIFTSMAWIRDFNINEPIYAELCHEFYSTYEFNEVCADDELQTKKIIKFRLGGQDDWYDKTQKNDLWLLSIFDARHQNEPGRGIFVRIEFGSGFGSMWNKDLYDRMGRMEIHHEAIERMKYRQSYHWDWKKEKKGRREAEMT